MLANKQQHNYIIILNGSGKHKFLLRIFPKIKESTTLRTTSTLLCTLYLNFDLKGTSLG